MTCLKSTRFALPLVLALIALPEASKAQDHTRDEQVATMTAQYAIRGYYHDLDYKVVELVQMQVLAILEGFSGKEGGDGSYRTDIYKLNEWMPHYKGQIAQLTAAVKREKRMDETDKWRFFEESARFADLVSAGEAIVDALNRNDAPGANRVFRSRSLPIAKGIRGSIYTMALDARSRFETAARSR